MKFFQYIKFIFFAFILGVSSMANAQIPVTDAAQISTHIANQVESIAKWSQQFQQMKTQIEQAQSQFNSMNGSRGMGNISDNEELRKLFISDLTAMLADIKKTDLYKNERAKYPNVANSPKLNAMYDTMAANNASLSDVYKKSNDRFKQVQELMTRIDTASDPAAKQDLANRLINEQNAIQASQYLVSLIQARQKIDLEAASAAAEKEYICAEFKKSNCP